MTHVYLSRPLAAALALLLFCASASAQLITSGDKYLGGILKGKNANSSPTISRAVNEDWEEYFDAVSPENAGKWNFVEPVRDQMDFRRLDKMYQFAVDRGLPFTIHSIIREEQEPPWLRQLPAAEIRAEVEEWIAALAARYPATAYIDVVNEAAHDRLGSDQLEAAFGGRGASGWDEVRAIYRLADEYFPDAELMLSDYDVIKGQVGNFNIIPIYDEVVRVLVADGTLDALGPQGHFLGGGKYDYDWVTRRLNELSTNSGGLPIHITEYDINTDNDAYQERKYRETVSAMYEHPDVQGVTLWGYYEDGTWLPNSHVVREDGSERPAMQWLRGYLRGPNKAAGILQAEDHDAMYGFRREGGTGTTYLNPDATRLSAMLDKDSSFLSFRHVAMAGATRATVQYRATGGPFEVSVLLDDQRNAPLTTETAMATANGDWAQLTIAFPRSIDDVRDVFIEVSGPDGALASFEVDFVGFDNAPLPAVLTDFTATNDGSGVDVAWATASEEGVESYVIERGASAEVFEVVGGVAAERGGPVTRARSYGFRDSAPLPGVSYYRLRTIDLDGTEAVSPVVAVDRDAYSALVAYPNPTQGRSLSVRLPAALEREATATLADVTGRVVHVERLDRGTSTREIRFAETLPAGAYQLTVAFGGGGGAEVTRVLVAE